MTREQLTNTFQNRMRTGKGVEVGTYKGEYAKEILSRWKGKLYLVDVWFLQDESIYADMSNQNNYKDIFSACVDNIKNNEDNLNFRYWVNQDRKRLDKANKKLSDCGLEDPKLSKKGSINDNLRHSFVLLGKDWVNAGKPKRPEEVEVEVPEGEVPNNDAVNTYGFAVGSKFPDCVDQGKICYGGINGNWAGSMAKALEVASWLKVLNFNAGSQKRTRENTASGKRSDHWVKSIDSYGIDLPCGKSKGDNGYKKLREEFVKRGWITADEMPDKRLERGKGKWVNFNVGSYRYQVGWNVPDHYDHIHVGVRYRGKTKK